MKILDRYILREYLITLLIITASFSVIFIVVDIFDRLPRLLRYNAEIRDIVMYFISRIPYLFVLTSPVAVLLSGLFLMNSLSKYNESIAIRAAGLSILRMVSPILWFGFFFSIFVMFFGEYVLPKSEAIRQVIYTEKIKNRKIEDIKMRSNIYYRGTGNNLYFIGFFDGYRNNLKTIDITTFDHENGNISRKITASKADWNGEEWVLENCYIRTFDHEGREVEALTEFHKETVVPELDATPLDFIKSARDPMSMNYFELRDYINRLKKVGENFRKELVDLHFKLSFPFANLIILLFCVPLASTSTRSKGRGLIFLLGLVICFMYLSAQRVSQSLGYNGVMSPLLSAWIANIVFAVVGIFFVVKAEV